MNHDVAYEEKGGKEDRVDDFDLLRVVECRGCTQSPSWNF